MDKNGNFRFVFNISITLLVQEKVSKNWVEARSAYASFTFKGKATTDKTNSKGEKLFSITPKMGEISQLKIYDKDENEIELESMVITSGFNVQMEKVFNTVRPFQLPMKQPPTPPEMECLGIKLQDLQIKFVKGYFEVSCGYKKVDKPRDPEICDNFIKALSEGPKNAKSSMDNLFGGMNPRDYVKEK